jgi:hypothetical protein
MLVYGIRYYNAVTGYHLFITLTDDSALHD